MQGNRCRDLYVVLGGRVAAKDGPRYLLQYAGTYHPQPGETTAKGKSLIPAGGLETKQSLYCIFLRNVPCFSQRKTAMDKAGEKQKWRLFVSILIMWFCLR